MQDNFKFGDDKEIVRIQITAAIPNDRISDLSCGVLCRIDRGDAEQRRCSEQEVSAQADSCFSRARQELAQPFEHRQQPILKRFSQAGIAVVFHGS